MIIPYAYLWQIFTPTHMMRAVDSKTEWSTIEGRQRRYTALLYYIVCICTLGIVHIVCKRLPRARVVIDTAPCNIEDADVLIHKKRGIDIEKKRVEDKDITDVVYEYIKDNTYKYADSTVYRDTDKKEKEILYGKNKLHTKIEPAWLIVFSVLFSEVNVYTMFGILLWIQIQYYVYAAIICILMVYTVITEVQGMIKKKTQKQKIADTQEIAYIVESSTHSTHSIARNTMQEA